VVNDYQHTVTISDGTGADPGSGEGGGDYKCIAFKAVSFETHYRNIYRNIVILSYMTGFYLSEGGVKPEVKINM
jgi:hypothetical protein